MLKLILVCIIVLASAGSFYWVKQNSGAMNFTFLDYYFETTVSEFFLWFLIFVFAVQFVSLTLYKIFSIPKQLKTYFADKNKAKLIENLSEVISDIAVDDSHAIFKKVSKLKGQVSSETYDILKYLSNRSEDKEELKAQLTVLIKNDRLKKVALQKLFEIAEEEGDYFIATNYCSELLKIEKNHRLVRRYVICFFKAKRWSELESILNSEGIIESMFIKNIAHYLGQNNTRIIKALCRYKIALEQCDMHDKETCKRYLKQAHTDLIGFIPIVKYLIDYLAKDDPTYCVRAIKRQWSEEPHYSLSDSLMTNFGSLNDIKFHNTLRDVAKRNPDHYESQILLIRSYLDMDQFEEASKHLSEVLQGDKKRRACALMAEYCLRTHSNKTEVMRWLRDSMSAYDDKQSKDYYWNLKSSSWQNYDGKNCIYVDSI